MGTEALINSITSGSANKNPYAAVQTKLNASFAQVNSIDLSRFSGVSEYSDLQSKVSELSTQISSYNSLIDTNVSNSRELFTSGRMNAAVGVSGIIDKVKAADGSAPQELSGCWPADVMAMIKAIDPDTINDQLKQALKLAAIAAAVALLAATGALDAIQDILAKIQEGIDFIQVQLDKLQAFIDEAEAKMNELLSFAQAYAMTQLTSLDPCAALFAGMLIEGI